MPTLTIVLDTNEYIFGLTRQKQSCVILLQKLSRYSVKLPRIILDELQKNLSNQVLRDCYQLILETKIEIIDEKVPMSIVKRYQTKLPFEDAIIASYCTFINVDYLISENRHFLVGFEQKDFKVASAQNFLVQEEKK